MIQKKSKFPKSFKFLRPCPCMYLMNQLTECPYLRATSDVAFKGGKRIIETNTPKTFQCIFWCELYIPYSCSYLCTHSQGKTSRSVKARNFVDCQYLFSGLYVYMQFISCTKLEWVAVARAISNFELRSNLAAKERISLVNRPIKH